MPLTKPYEKISIIGAGLMGGSLAYALVEKQLAKKLVILARTKEAIAEIQNKAAHVTINYEDLTDSDLIFIATPLSTYEEIFKKLENLTLKKEVIISDVGSVKNKVKILAKEHMQSWNFVATHPIAGSERSGTGVLVKDLYQNKKIIITEKQHKQSMEVARIWEEIGGKIEYMEANSHDQIYAYVSHLVQNIAFNLNYLFHHSRKDLAELNKDYNNESFSKFTRLYFSNKRMWQDIFFFNQEHLQKALAEAQEELQRLVVNFDQLIRAKKNQEISKLTVKDLDFFLASLVANLVKEVVANKIANYQEYAGSGFDDFVSIIKDQKRDLSDLASGDLGYLRDRLANLLNYLY